MISDDVNPEDDAHLHEIKKRILAADRAKQKRLKKAYDKNTNFDATKGLCCCRYQNATGAKFIITVDCILLPVIFRWVFAVWAVVDPLRIEIYSRVRILTCYYGWAIGFLSFVIWALF